LKREKFRLKVLKVVVFFISSIDKYFAFLYGNKLLLLKNKNGNKLYSSFYYLIEHWRKRFQKLGLKKGFIEDKNLWERFERIIIIL